MSDGPWRITFDTNPDICNIHCIMCEEHSRLRKDPIKNIRMMDPDIITEVISSASGNGLKEIIPSTMGEPLLYPHFNRFLELAEEYNLKINLTTNGTFPFLGVTDWSNRILPMASDVKVSINGASRDVNEGIMDGIDHDSILSNITELIRIRDEVRKSGINHPNISFQVTLMQRNLRDLKNLLELAIDLNVDRLKGHHLWITWPELEEESLTKYKQSREEWNKVAKELKDTARNKIQLANISELSIDDIDSKLPDDYVCPFAGKEAWIAWDGTLNVCCAPDNLRKKFGHFGNVTEEPFMDLWRSVKYRDFVKVAGKTEICKKCNMKIPPEGGG